MPTFDGAEYSRWMQTAEEQLRRQTERDWLLREAQAFADRLDPALGIRWVAVYGSGARGDFNAYSDIDVLVVADRLPADYRERLAALDWPAADRVEPVAWTSLSSRVSCSDATPSPPWSWASCWPGSPRPSDHSAFGQSAGRARRG